MALTKVPSNLDAAVSVTQSQSDNSTNVATTAYVDLAISNLSDSAPAALNTLNEIAAALGDNENYAATTTAAIADKLPLGGGTMTGTLVVPAVTVGNSSIGSNSSHLANITINNNGYIGTAYDATSLNFTTAGDLVATGKLGIGTPVNTAPAHPLHITKELAGYQAYFNNDNGSAQGIKVRIKSNDSGNFNMLELVSASTGSDVTAMVVRDDGNVGIGTAAPGAKLAFGGSNANIWLNNDASNPFGMDTVGGELRLFTGNANSYQMKFGKMATDGTTFTSHLTIGDDGSNRGNVGIGTDTPAEKLEVDGSIRVGNLKIQPAFAGRIGFNRNTSNGVIYDSGYSAVQINGPASSNPNYMAFETYNSSGGNGTVAMVIEEGGNIGIGTTDPDQPLHVVGTRPIRIQRNGVGEFEIMVDNTVTGDSSDFVIEPVSGTNSAGFQVRTRNTAGSILEALDVNHDGYVAMPYQPAMFAQPNSTATVQLGTGAKKFGWNTSGGVRFNRGFTLSGSAGNTVFDGNNTGKIMVPMDGVYHLYFDMRCESTGGDGQAGIWINGTQVIRRHIQEWSSIPYSHCTITATFNLQATDYIEMGMWWNSTTGGPVSGLSDTVNWMSLTKIS